MADAVAFRIGDHVRLKGTGRTLSFPLEFTPNSPG